MRDYNNLIEKYLKGELTPAEMHALEKEALNDPFLAEALEGAELIDGVQFSKDVATLNENILIQKSSGRLWVTRIAASLLLLAVSAFILWSVMNQEPEQNLVLTPSVNDNRINSQSKSAVPSPEPEKITPISEETTSVIHKKSSKKDVSVPSVITPEKRSIDTSSYKEEIAPESQRIAQTDAEIKNQVLITQESKKQTIKPFNPTQQDKGQSMVIREGYITPVDARPTIVTGMVVSAEDGTPLPDVSVALKGTSVITKTDARGIYAIAADNQNQTLVYSSDGLENTEVKITGNDSTYLPVKIESNAKTRQESVIETNTVIHLGPTDIYSIPAHPETGNRNFKQYLEKTLNYPKEAVEKGIEGRVIIEFRVNTSGALSEFKIIRGIGNGCDEELIRLILQGAKWIPTVREGVPINDRARVRYKFELKN